MNTLIVDEMVDVFKECNRREISIHQCGLLALVDVMPRMVPKGQTADSAIVQAARISHGKSTTPTRDDRELIRYLMRHQHSSPFEMVEFKFYVVLPIFVARQWVRHRTASINEYSARYSIMPGRFYHISCGDDDTKRDFADYLERCEAQYTVYQSLIERGVDRETARIGLPLSIYTEWYWKCDLRNIFHFLELRLGKHAQEEIREYAQAMLDLIQPIVPIATEAFADYNLDGIRLSRLEVEALREKREIDSDSKRECREWREKRVLLQK